MEWIKASELLPAHGQEVLVRYRSIVDLAVYNQSFDNFILKNGSTLNWDKDQLRWAMLADHGPSKVHSL